MINWNNYNSNWKKLLGFRTMQEKLLNSLYLSETFISDYLFFMSIDFLKDYLFLTIGILGSANNDVTQKFVEVCNLLFLDTGIPRLVRFFG